MVANGAAFLSCSLSCSLSWRYKRDQTLSCVLRLSSIWATRGWIPPSTHAVATDGVEYNPIVRGSACLGLLAMSNPDVSGLFSPATDLVVPCRHDAGASGRCHRFFTRIKLITSWGGESAICEAKEVVSSLTFGWALASVRRSPPQKWQSKLHMSPRL